MNYFDVASFFSSSFYKPVKSGGSKSSFSIFIHDSNQMKYTETLPVIPALVEHILSTQAVEFRRQQRTNATPNQSLLIEKMSLHALLPLPDHIITPSLILPASRRRFRRRNCRGIVSGIARMRKLRSCAELCCVFLPTLNCLKKGSSRVSSYQPAGY
jgi:hypothetical protein